jgi:hypothetical protein
MWKVQKLFKFSITIVMEEWKSDVKFERKINCI